MLENLKEDLAYQIDEFLGEVEEGFYEEAVFTLSTIKNLLSNIIELDEDVEDDECEAR